MAFILCVGLCIQAHAQAQSFVIDQERSHISFKISHLAAFKVDGSFQKFSGQLELDGTQLKSLKSRIEVGSIFTDNEERDDIIKNEAYLDVAQFPFIAFESIEINATEGQTLLKGILKIKAEEREITFPYDLMHSEQNDEKIFKAETLIRRSDFNLVFGSMNGLIGDKIEIQLYIVVQN